MASWGVHKGSLFIALTWSTVCIIKYCQMTVLGDFKNYTEYFWNLSEGTFGTRKSYLVPRFMNYLATLKFFFSGYCTQFPTNSNAHETFSLQWSAALKRFSTYEFSLVCVSCASTTVLQQQCFIFQLFIKWTKKILKGKPSPKFL